MNQHGSGPFGASPRRAVGWCIVVAALAGTLAIPASASAVTVELKPSAQQVRVKGVSIYRHHSARFDGFARLLDRLGPHDCADGSITWDGAGLVGQLDSLGGPACPPASTALTTAIFTERGARVRTSRGAFRVGWRYRRLPARLRSSAWVVERILDEGGYTVYGLQLLSDPCRPSRTLRRSDPENPFVQVVVADADRRVINAAISMPIREGIAC